MRNSVGVAFCAALVPADRGRGLYTHCSVRSRVKPLTGNVQTAWSSFVGMDGHHTCHAHKPKRAHGSLSVCATGTHRQLEPAAHVRGAMEPCGVPGHAATCSIGLSSVAGARARGGGAGAMHSLGQEAADAPPRAGEDLWTYGRVASGAPAPLLPLAAAPHGINPIGEGLQHQSMAASQQTQSTTGTDPPLSANTTSHLPTWGAMGPPVMAGLLPTPHLLFPAAAPIGADCTAEQSVVQVGLAHMRDIRGHRTSHERLLLG